MKKTNYTVDIAASKERVWETLWGKETYKAWTTPFSAGSDAKTDWQEGSKVLFVDGTNKGMVSRIEKKIPNEYMAFQHLGMYDNGVEDMESEQVKAWAGSMETYTLSGTNGHTHVEVELDVPEDMRSYFDSTFPKALDIVKNISEGKMATQKLSTFLWYNDKAEEAARHYTAIFKNSFIKSILYNGNSGPAGAAGTVMSATIEINGQEWILFNGGPLFTFSPAVSMFITCETQEEIDQLWQKLGEGGREDQCGWVQDKYGLMWQVVPSILPGLFQDPDPLKAKRAVDAMLQMKKLDIKKLTDAFNGV